jgi:hypothetical protein
MREDRVGEKVGIDFDELRKGSAKIEVSQVNGPEEGVSGDNRVKEKIDTGERSYVGGRGARRLESVTSGGVANPTVNAGGEASARAGVKEGGKRPLLFGDGIEVGGWGGGDEVGTNTAALPTVNALFHSIVSTHSLMATIDIVDYYVGAILPSPESVRIDDPHKTWSPAFSPPLPRQTFSLLRCSQNCLRPSPIRPLIPTSSCRSSHPT